MGGEKARERVREAAGARGARGRERETRARERTYPAVRACVRTCVRCVRACDKDGARVAISVGHIGGRPYKISSE